MTVSQRIQSEQEFHDRQATSRATTLSKLPDAYQFSDESYLSHESWIRPAFSQLGDLAGRRVLDYGCGHGMAAIVLARRGGLVSGFDLSAGYVAEARQRAHANGVLVDFEQADAHCLPYENESFDAVFGNAILHHLDLQLAGRELVRILKPKGVAVFCEPWRENPLLQLARRRATYSGKEHTPDELPLGTKDVETLRAFFPNLQLRGHQLLSMIRRVFTNKALVRRLEVCDDRLLRWMPGLQRWSRYVVLVLRR